MENNTLRSLAAPAHSGAAEQDPVLDRVLLPLRRQDAAEPQILRTWRMLRQRNNAVRHRPEARLPQVLLRHFRLRPHRS